MEMTSVRNLRTGDTAEYYLPANEAVVCAHRQLTCKDWNSWAYDFSHAVYSTSGLTVRCGDWCALTAKPISERNAILSKMLAG